MSAVAVALGEIAVVASSARPVAWTALAITLALVALGALLWVHYSRLPQRSWFFLAFGAVAVVLSLNLITEDAGGGAQVGFLLPVVYAGTFLRAGAAWTVAVAAVVADAVVVFTLLPPEQAISDHAFVLVAIVALTWVLVKMGRHQDALVEQLRRVAALDGLTGLATRRALEEKAELVLAARPSDVTARVGAARVDDLAVLAARDPGRLGTALLLIDLDNFKEINDAHGHPVGDEVLVHVGRLLRNAVRRGDTVARFGGDELAVLVPDVAREEGRRLAENLREIVQRDPMRTDVGPIHLTVSIGVAHAGAGDGGIEELYRAADDALYRAKRDGRDRVVVLDPGQVTVDDEAVS